MVTMSDRELFLYLILNDKVHLFKNNEELISFAYHQGLPLEAFGNGEYKKAEEYLLAAGGKIFTEEEALLFVGVLNGVTKVVDQDITDGYELGEDVWFDLCHRLFPTLSIYKFRYQGKGAFLFATDSVSAHKRIRELQ